MPAQNTATRTSTRRAPAHPDVRIASLFQNRRNQAVRIPREFEFTGVKTVEIERKGEELLIRPAKRQRKTWTSLIGAPKLDFVLEREPLFDEDRLTRDFQ